MSTRFIRETINGRPYVIEVLPVEPDRWRAHIAQGHGGTTALMPFYGETPDAAAARLTGWLSRASAPVSKSNDLTPAEPPGRMGPRRLS